jgi:hypothetical protein
VSTTDTLTGRGEKGEPMTDVVQHRSKAWLLGWLAISGPASVVLSVLIVFASRNVNIYIATMLLQFWVLAGCVLGIAAIVVGVRDRKQALPFAVPGAVIGAAGTLICVAELGFAGYVLAALSQL